MVYGKDWYKSRTVWINILIFVLGLAAYILKGIQTGEVQLDVSPETISMLYGIIGILLRRISSQPLRW